MKAFQEKQECQSLPCEVMTGGSLLLARQFESTGEVTERLKAAVLKTVEGLTTLRGFESLPLRQRSAGT